MWPPPVLTLRDDPYRVPSLYRRAVDGPSLEHAFRIAFHETGGGRVEVAEQIVDAVAVDVLVGLVAVYKTLLVAGPAEGDGQLINDGGGVEAGGRDDGYSDLPAALEVDVVVGAAGLYVLPARAWGGRSCAEGPDDGKRRGDRCQRIACQGIACQGIACQGIACQGIACQGIACQGIA